MSVDWGNIVEGALAGLVAGLVAAFFLDRLRAYHESRKEKADIKLIRSELKGLKETSDDLYGHKELEHPEEFYRREVYENMRKSIKPVLNRLSSKKQLELSRALYRNYGKLLIQVDERYSDFVESPWPTGGIDKNEIDEIFKSLEGLKWLKINK